MTNQFRREPQASRAPETSAPTSRRPHRFCEPPSRRTTGEGLPVVDAARILHQALRDHSYEETRLGPWVTKFLRWLGGERGARPATVDDYERTLARMAIMLAHLGLDDVTTDDLRVVRDSYPAGSQSKVTYTMKSFWKFWYLEERIDRDPAARLRSAKKKQPLTYDVFTQDEEATLITQGPDRELHRAVTVRDRACLLLLLRTGLRAGELRQLRVEDIDLVERWVLIRDGKGGYPRAVPYARAGEDVSLGRALEEFMLTELPYERRLPEHGDHLFWGYHQDNLNTTGSDGFNAIYTRQPAVASALHRWWKRCVDRAHVRYRNMHMCRHTFATNLVRAGVPLVTIKEILGHQSIKTTVGYTHVMAEDKTRAVELLDTWRKGNVLSGDRSG